MSKIISRKDASTRNAVYDNEPLGSLITPEKKTEVPVGSPEIVVSDFFNAWTSMLQAMTQKIATVGAPEVVMAEPEPTAVAASVEVPTDLGYEFEIEFDEDGQAKALTATDNSQINNVYSIDRRDSGGKALHYKQNASGSRYEDCVFTVEERDEDDRIYRVGVNGEYELLVTKRSSGGKLSKFKMVDGPTFSILSRGNSGDVVDFAVA